MKELEKQFNKCWSNMLRKAYTCKCKNHEGFAIRLMDLHIFGKKFKKDLFTTIENHGRQNKKFGFTIHTNEYGIIIQAASGVQN